MITPVALPISHLTPGTHPASIESITVGQYHAMIAADCFSEADPVELLEGQLVRKMPKTPSHSGVTLLMGQALQEKLPTRWCVRLQEPITTDESKPEPDITVARGTLRDYLKRHPSPMDIGMIGEISDSSLARDRGVKKRIFARDGIAIYWIVNLVERQVEVFSDPSESTEKPDYRKLEIYGEKDSGTRVTDGISVLTLRVAEILG